MKEAAMKIRRRDAMKMLLAISASGALAACGNQTSTEETETDPMLRYTSDNEFLSVEEMALLSALAQTIIPKTDTPGAVEVGIPLTLQELLSSWGDDQVRLYWRAGLQSIATHFQETDGVNSFAKLSSDERESILSQLDADVYSEIVTNDFYKDMKATIGTAYYMSEPGATAELLYDPVPGDFKGCIPFADVGRAWAT